MNALGGQCCASSVQRRLAHEECGGHGPGRVVASEMNRRIRCQQDCRNHAQPIRKHQPLGSSPLLRPLAAATTCPVVAPAPVQIVLRTD